MTTNLTESWKDSGGALTSNEIYANAEQLPALKAEAATLESIDLTERQLHDIELLLNGGFAPLKGFLNERDYMQVIQRLHLASGELWPIPITLDVSNETRLKLKIGQKIALKDPENRVLATLDIESIWQPNKTIEAEYVYGTNDNTHPGVRYLKEKAGPFYIGGKITGLNRPVHYDYQHRRHSPQELKALFKELGWEKIVGFQTRNPLHRAHVQLTLNASAAVGAKLLLHPVVGLTKPGDVDHHTRVRCYEAVLPQYEEGLAQLSLLPLAMRMAGPREALWHALIRRNYGLTHFIVGRDHAGPGNDSQGKPFYGAYEAQELVKKYADEIGIKILPFNEMVYLPARDKYVPVENVGPNVEVLQLSGTELRKRLESGQELPAWFSYPSVVEELRKTYPQPAKQGFTVFFTGLSGSGKSTIANALEARLMSIGGRNLSVLDGDVVRKNLSKGLGFSKEDRNANVLRIGYVASEITKHGGIAICAPIAPYEETRKQVREAIEPFGRFIEVYVATPLEECERRDTKGLYALARAGTLKNFTGIDDPYEEPWSPDVLINTTEKTVDQAVEAILEKIHQIGLIPRPAPLLPKALNAGQNPPAPPAP